MATPSDPVTGGTRHRIKAIELQPPVSKCPVILKLLVDGNVVYRTPEIPRGELLLWERIPPCDVKPSSQITIRIHERYAFVRRRCIGSIEYELSDVGLQPRTFQLKGLSVNITFPAPEQARDIAAQALSHAQASPQKERFMEKLGAVRGVIKAVLDFGGAVAELDPRAKAVFAVVNKVWEKLEAQEKCDASVEALLDGLAGILPNAEAVQEAAKLKELRNTIEDMWKLIEDASRFIDDYRSKGEVVHTLGQYRGSNAQEQVNDILARLGGLKEEFDRGIRIQAFQTGERALQMVDEHVQRALLEKLKPVGRARYDTSRACIPGTREGVIQDLIHWVKSFERSGTLDEKKRLLWVYGQAGLGKSAVATSLCQALDDERLLSASFFCKRDDPKRRNAQRALSTIIYWIASRHATYASSLRKALEEDPVLPSSPLQMQFDKLFVDLLSPLTSSAQDTCHVIVVDALDECGPDADRRQLLRFLVRMSELVPWLRVVITSRPDSDIKSFFDLVKASTFSTCDLRGYDASNDIRAFTHFRLSESAKGRLLPESSADELAVAAEGLFIWAHTACEFVLEDVDPTDALHTILRRDRSGLSHPLDELYTLTIQASVTKQRASDRAKAAVRKYLGAIIVCSARTPLPISTLSGLIDEDQGSKALQSTVDLLGSVLYIDQSLGDVVRVYHPSFADYMLSKDRSGDFCVDLDDLNAKLASCCLKTMMAELRFNICDLETSFVRNSEIPDLEARVAQVINERLKYSCLYWTSHLKDVEASEHIASLQSRLYEFARGPVLVFWVEALSLIGKLWVAISSLQELIEHCVARQILFPQQLWDTTRLVQAFYQPISESTPHLYISALGLMPTGVLTREVQRKHFPNVVKVVSAAQENWPNRDLCMSHEDNVYAVAISCDGRRVISGSTDRTVRIWDADTGAPIGEPLKGHSDSVRSVAYSPDGRRIVSGSADKTMRIWDADTGAPIGEPLEGHSSSVWSVAYSPDGRRIVSGSADETVRIWDADTGAPIGEPLEGHSDSVFSVAYSPDGRRIVSGSADKTMRIWDADTGAPIGEPLEGHSSSVWSAAYSPDGRRIVSGSNDKTLRIWDADTGAPIGEPLKGHSSSVLSVAYSPDGRRIVSGSHDKTVRIWDADTGAPIGEPLRGHSGSVYSVAYSPDGRRIASGSDDSTVQVCGIGMTQVLFEILIERHGDSIGKPLEGHSSSVFSVAYSPDGRRIVSGSNDKTVRIWDADTGALIGEPLRGHSSSVWSVAYSPDGRRIVSGSNDKAVRIWDADTSAPIGEPLEGHSDSVFSVAYSPDGRRIVSGSADKTMRIWDADTGAPIGEPLEGHSSLVWSAAYSPDGRRIVSGSADETVRIWDADTGAPIGEPLEGHSFSVLSVAYSPDGRRIVSGSHDKTVRIWDADTGAPIGEPLEGHSSSVWSAAYSPDGRRIVSSSHDKTVRIWDADTGAPIGEPLEGHSFSVLSVAYSPDGRRIVSGSHDKTVRIWDADTGAPIGEPLEGHSSSVWSAAYSPDGRRIVSSSHDKTVRIWDADTGAPIGEPLEGHSSSVFSVAYSPEAQFIVSSDEYSIRIWDAKCVNHKTDSLSRYCQLIQNSLMTEPRPLFLHSDHAFQRCLQFCSATRYARHGVPFIKKYISSAGWVSVNPGQLLFWLPFEYRQHQPNPDSDSDFERQDHSVCIIYDRQQQENVWLDLCRFSHGSQWTNVYAPDESKW
ncbi:WD40 repeat-like protein [Ceratobasidium sp. AG-Ba]|nr:WD40 repeat-like protein [Ceratobasidium sp. AG-Ba]